MTSLTETAFYTRKGITWLVVGLVVFLVLRFVILLGIGYYKQANPPAKIPPSVDFGKLERLVFPTIDRGVNLSYRLEIKEGGLPEFPDRFIVYFVPKESPSLLSNQRAAQFAGALGFNSEPVAEGQSSFRFSDSTHPRTLTVNPLTRDFSLKYDFGTDTKVLGSPPLTAEQGKTAAIEFFKNLGLLGDDVDSANGVSKLLNFENNKLVPTTNLSDVKAIRIDLFRKPIGDVPIVSPELYNSLIYTVYTGKSAIEERFIEAGYHSFSVDMTTKGVYPIKTAQQALDELEKGEGYIVHKGNGVTQAVIRRVYLAYYESPVYQPYVQPVVVFKGDDEFAAYVPAIINEWTNQSGEASN